MPESTPLSAQILNQLQGVLTRVEALLVRFEARLPPPVADPDWTTVVACRWRRKTENAENGVLIPVIALHPIRLEDLSGIEAQKENIVANTRQFLSGRPANNALLTGARGSGKSSLVKALLNAFSARGLRLIEIDKEDLLDLPEIVERVRHRPEKFLIFCDDLSFDSGENAYKALKSALDGSIAASPENVLIYATSNRRHLMPEFFSENLETSRVNGEIHPGEATEEKISLSERFGLWVSFYPFDQDEYLAIVAHWLSVFGFSGAEIAAAERDALNWALGRGSRSGRVAWQFARDCAGKRMAAADGK